MFYSKKTEYLIRALLVIGDSWPTATFVSVETILKQTKLPRALTLKLLNQCVKQGMLESIIGKSGGYRFLRKPQDITLLEIKLLFDPANHWDGCALGLAFCNESNPCALHHEWKALREPLIRFISETTFDRLIAEYRKNRSLITSLSQILPAG